MNIRDFVEQDGRDYMRRHGITPGLRSGSNSPETFQSDLVEEAAEKILSDRKELSDVLGDIFENLVPPAVTDLLALLTLRSPVDADGELTAEFAAAECGMDHDIRELVYKYCRKESGL